MKLQKKNTVRADVAIIDKALAIVSRKLMLILLVIIGFITINQTAMAQAVPCFPETKGLYYSYPAYSFSPVLFSNMPYDILQAYIIADSIIKYSNEAANFAKTFLKRFDKNEITYDNDTLNYAYKYLYKLSDYDPLLFFDFILNGKTDNRKIHAGMVYENLTECIAKSTSGKQKRRMLRSYYILHIYVDTTILFVKDPNGELLKDYTIVYAQVLDTIKGKILPNLNTAFITNNMPPNNVTTAINTMATNTNTNLIFDYCNQWLLAGGNHYTTYNGELQGTMKDENGNNWVKPKLEYIVLLAPNYECASNGQLYYSLWPVGGSYSRGMYPIKNGNVIDGGNVWGWGTSVPIDIFKSNLNALINEIKNYGE